MNIPSLCRPGAHCAWISVVLLSVPSVFAVDKKMSATAPLAAVWATASNWSPSGVPTATDDVIFDWSSSTTPTSMALHSGLTFFANSLTFGSASGPALGDFIFKNANSGSSGRTLTLSNGGIIIASQVVGAQAIQSFGGVMTINADDGSFEVSNNSSQSLTIGAKLADGISSTSVAFGGTGSGVISISGVNTFTGVTTIANGTTLSLGSTTALGATTAGTTINSGGTLNVNTTSTAEPLTLNGAGVADTGALTTNRTTGSTVVTGAVTLGSSATVTNSNASLLALQGGVGGTGNLTLKTQSTGGITISTVSANHDGLITNSGSGSGGASITTPLGPQVDGVVQNSATSSLTLNAANTYTGPTQITAGTLILGSSGSVNNSSGVQVSAGATFDIVAKTSGYSVNSLAGGGAVNGLAGQALTVSNALAAGDAGIGTLTLNTGNLTLANGASLDYDIGGTTAAPLSDVVSLLGAGSTVSLSGNYTLNLSNIGGLIDPTGKTFVLFDSGAAITSPGTWTIQYGSTGWASGSVQLSSGNLVLTGLTAVPEPSQGSLILLAIGLSFAVRRRRS